MADHVRHFGKSPKILSFVKLHDFAVVASTEIMGGAKLRTESQLVGTIHPRLHSRGFLVRWVKYLNTIITVCLK